MFLTGRNVAFCIIKQGFPVTVQVAQNVPTIILKNTLKFFQIFQIFVIFFGVVW